MHIQIGGTTPQETLTASQLKQGLLYEIVSAPKNKNLHRSVAIKAEKNRVSCITQDGVRILDAGDSTLRFRRLPPGTSVMLRQDGGQGGQQGQGYQGQGGQQGQGLSKRQRRQMAAQSQGNGGQWGPGYQGAGSQGQGQTTF